MLLKASSPLLLHKAGKAADERHGMWMRNPSWCPSLELDLCLDAPSLIRSCAEREGGKEGSIVDFPSRSLHIQHSSSPSLPRQYSGRKAVRQTQSPVAVVAPAARRRSAGRDFGAGDRSFAVDGGDGVVIVAERRFAEHSGGGSAAAGVS